MIVGMESSETSEEEGRRAGSKEWCGRQEEHGTRIPRGGGTSGSCRGEPGSASFSLLYVIWVLNE